MKEKMDPKSLLLGLVLGAGVVFLVAGATTDKPDKPAEVLRVRKLVVVDEKGAERVVIAAQVPDPQIGGKRSPRRSPAAGIQFNDASGNERGGIGMLDDGSFILGIDDQRSRERAHMFFIPKRGAGLLLQGANGKEHISLSIPDDEGAPSGKPELEITDHEGRVTLTLPASK